MRLQTLLQKPSFYSYEASATALALSVDRPELLRLATSLGEKKGGDSVNVFTFKDTEYIGLESRRLDYERDKANGTNHVEEKIKSGWYDNKGVRRRRSCRSVRKTTRKGCWC
jgi:hypothetical protein